MPLVVQLLLAVGYMAMLAILGLRTITRGHKVLFAVGFLVPVLWIVGALMKPTPGSLAAAEQAAADA